MLNQATLIDEVAAYKKDSKRHFDKAVLDLLALAWPHRKEGFTFDPSFALYDDALSICVVLSNRCAESARARLLRTIESLEWDGDPWDEVYDQDEESRFDMAGTHLLDLLSIWISVAAVNGWTQGYTRVMVSRYLTNPFLCPEWSTIPLDALKWGRGYAKDIAEQLAIIGQGLIVSGARLAEQEDERERGATYYVRHRGSNYDCPDCDDLSERPIPIDVPFVTTHPRCVCWPEYFYD